MHEITQRLNTNIPYQNRARVRYKKMPDEQKRQVEAGYMRHLRACEKLGISPDPTWLPECIGIMTGAKI